MDDLPVVLHVGAPKAGSSALQYDLTWDPRRPLVGRPGLSAEYVAIDAAGSLLRGDALDAFASLYAARYCMSADLADLAALRADSLRAVAGELAAMRGGGTIPLLSYELWLRAPRDQVHRFTAALAAPLHVVVYVRDPVSWLHSLLWQRRGPLECGRRAWIEEYADCCRWAEPVATWRSAPGVVRLDVRIADRSVPRDFSDLVGFEPARTDMRYNHAISGEFARYLERHALSPELHVSEARFAWNRWTTAAGVGDAFEPAPWRFDADDLRLIVEQTASSSAALLPYCDDDVRSRIVADARWWSADPEVHAGPRRCVSPSTPVEEADRLLDAALKALVAADGAWRSEGRQRRLAESASRELELEASASREVELEARLAESARREAEMAAALDEARRELALAQAVAEVARRRDPVARLRGMWRRHAA